MAAGLGYFDAQGIWQFGEADTEVLYSDLLNKGMQSVTDALTLDRARLGNLEADTGWVNVPLRPGLTGSARYRVVGPLAEIRYDISGTLTSNLQLTDALPSEVAPSAGDPDTLALASYVNSPSAGATAFISNTSRTLRFVGTGSRVRGGGTWLIG